jgi:hypothetical protein
MNSNELTSHFIPFVEEGETRRRREGEKNPISLCLRQTLYPPCLLVSLSWLSHG